MNHAWPVPTALLPGELLSSWLTRAALAQGCDPLVLTNVLWPDWRVWTRDPDRGLSEERLSVVERAAGIEASRFEEASLHPTAAVVTGGGLNDLAIWPWMLALGTRNRKRLGGLQYCPACLRADKVPYYRLHWRFAWHTACAEHGIFLLDRCPECNSPIEPHRLLADSSHVGMCATCKYDLRTAESSSVEQKSAAFQVVADEVLLVGQGAYGTEKLLPAEWFELARYFVTLLRKVARSSPKGLTAFAKELCVDTAHLRPASTGLPLELLSSKERALLLTGAWEMLNAGPRRFLDAAKTVSLTKASLTENGQYVPERIEALIDDLHDRRVDRTANANKDVIRPRSCQAVRRMFARLQRKARLISEYP